MSNNATEVMTLIATNPSWSWANSESALKPLRTCVDAVQAHKQSSDFWKDMALATPEDIKATCKEMSLDVVQMHVDKATAEKKGSFTHDVTKLEKQVKAMIAMNAKRAEIDSDDDE